MSAQQQCKHWNAGATEKVRFFKKHLSFERNCSSVKKSSIRTYIDFCSSLYLRIKNMILWRSSGDEASERS